MKTLGWRNGRLTTAPAGNYLARNGSPGSAAPGMVRDMKIHGFRIVGLPAAPFRELMSLDDTQLADRGIERHVADAPFAFPCRVTLEDALPGEELLLLSYRHQPAATPYAASGPIFVRRRAAAQARIAVNEVPDQQRRRLLSVRAYDARHYLIDADVAPGTELEGLIDRFFGNAQVGYLHVHNAKRGCYACRVERGAAD